MKSTIYPLSCNGCSKLLGYWDLPDVESQYIETYCNACSSKKFHRCFCQGNDGECLCNKKCGCLNKEKKDT